MKATIISAGNVVHARGHSASIKAAEIVKDVLGSRGYLEVTTIPLVDAELKPCVMCGKCYPEWKCIYDQDFNQVLESLRQTDVAYFVVPHYAPIPSKMAIVLEKLQEMCFIQMCVDNSTPFFLKNRPVCLVAHGGSTQEYIHLYKENLINPIAAALRAVGIRVVGASEEWPNGMAFGVKGYERAESGIFPTPIHDWDAIRLDIESYVSKVHYTAQGERA